MSACYSIIIQYVVLEVKQIWAETLTLSLTEGVVPGKVLNSES